MTSAHRASRRSVLAAAALALPGIAALEACAAGRPGADYADTDPVRLESLGDELSLIAAYQQAIAGHPTLAGRLQPILDQHAAHAASLRTGAGTSGDAPQPLASASPVGAAVQVAGGTDADVLASLQEAERAAAALRAGACVRATDSSLASLLVLIGASEAQHVVALGGSAE